MANSAEALQNLQNYQSTMQSPTALITNAQNALGVQGALGQVQGLRGAINQTTGLLKQVAPGVMGRTGNSLVTSAQANRQIQNESAPLQEKLGEQSKNYNQAYQDYSDLEKQAEARANAELEGQRNQLSYLQSIYGALYQQEKDAAERAFQQQQFEYAKQKDAADRAAAARAAASSFAPSLGGAAAAKPTRNDYNSALSSIEAALKSYQGAGYRGAIGSRDQTKNALIQQFQGLISPQEIKGYVDTLYNRYYVR